MFTKSQLGTLVTSVALSLVFIANASAGFPHGVWTGTCHVYDQNKKLVNSFTSDIDFDHRTWNGAPMVEPYTTKDFPTRIGWRHYDAKDNITYFVQGAYDEFNEDIDFHYEVYSGHLTFQPNTPSVTWINQGLGDFKPK